MTLCSLGFRVRNTSQSASTYFPSIVGFQTEQYKTSAHAVIRYKLCVQVKRVLTKKNEFYCSFIYVYMYIAEFIFEWMSLFWKFYLPNICNGHWSLALSHLLWFWKRTRLDRLHLLTHLGSLVGHHTTVLRHNVALCSLRSQVTSSFPGSLNSDPCTRKATISNSHQTAPSFLQDLKLTLLLLKISACREQKVNCRGNR